MKVHYRNIGVLAISYLLILLFVYAAVNKILDFPRFSRQLSQSPLLFPTIGRIVAWVVPVVELVIAITLVLPKYRLWGLYGGTGLMIVFTAYIFSILNFSGYIPCACGGVLESLGWRDHLFFNLGFVALGIMGIYLERQTQNTSLKI